MSSFVARLFSRKARSSGLIELSSGAALAQVPTIAIHQNADHVAGMIQQVYRQPLLTEESREKSARAVV